MGTLSDITGLLEKIPLWKRLKRLPEDFDQLAQRVAALERALNETPPADACPKCRKRTYELASSRPHPMGGIVGKVERTYKCSACGFTENKLV
jgi:hypothetical protein